MAISCCVAVRSRFPPVRLRGERGGKCLQRQPHLQCINTSQLWRRATQLFNRFTPVISLSRSPALMIGMVQTHVLTRVFVLRWFWWSVSSSVTLNPKSIGSVLMDGQAWQQCRGTELFTQPLTAPQQQPGQQIFSRFGQAVLFFYEMKRSDFPTYVRL